MKRIAASLISAGLLAVPAHLSLAASTQAGNATAELAPVTPSAGAKTDNAPKAEPAPTKLACRAGRGDLGIFEPLRYMSITIDTGKKYVKMVHEGDGRIIEFTDGAGGAQGSKNFVRVTDESVVYGQGHESWKIDRYTGTLTNASIGIPFECQLRPTERKF